MTLFFLHNVRSGVRTILFILKIPSSVTRGSIVDAAGSFNQVSKSPHLGIVFYSLEESCESIKLISSVITRLVFLVPYPARNVTLTFSRTLL